MHSSSAARSSLWSEKKKKNLYTTVIIFNEKPYEIRENYVGFMWMAATSK